MNGCYKVVNRNLNWADAGRECRSLHRDAHLLVINDAQEQQAVGLMLNSTSGQFLVLVFFIVSLTLSKKLRNRASAMHLFVA